MKTYIRVDANIMTANYKNGTRLPCVVVREESGRKWHCQKAHGSGPFSVLYEPDDPLSCGARCWIETDSEVVMEGAAAQDRCPPEPKRV